MKFQLGIATACILTFLSSSSIQAQELTSIFDGKTLGGWNVEPADQSASWTIEEGGIIKLENGTEKKGSTLWTDKEYSNFVLEFEFKMGKGTVDTGIYMRNNKDQIQIGISGSLKRDMTGSPYIPGKGYPSEAKGVAELLKLDDWNEMTIVGKGKNYSVWLNGQHVIAYDSDTAIEKGPLGIQLHGNREMSAYYRNIRIAELAK